MGHSATVTIRKIKVKAASTSDSAISLGVRWRMAPSTRAIMRSRKDLPAPAVISTTMRSDSTRVPPVTPERSPPDSRMTGADSPVIADSSTEATPSMISPSEGMYSPAETSTRSPARSLELATCSVFPEASRRLATVSERALRSVSAWALPRPSAMASAKLANATVNQSQSVICRLNLKAGPPLNRSTVVITLPISTTNMTGLPIILRGLSFRKASQRARRTIFPSQIAFLRGALVECAMGPAGMRGAVVGCGVIAIVIALKSLACAHEQMFKDRPQAERREKRECPQDQNHADKERREQRCCHRESAERWRNIFLLRQVSGDGEHGDDHQEPAREHGDRHGRVIPGGVHGQASEGRAVVAGAGGEGVQDFGHAVWTGIGDPRSAERFDH